MALDKRLLDKLAKEAEKSKLNTPTPRAGFGSFVSGISNVAAPITKSISSTVNKVPVTGKPLNQFSQNVGATVGGMIGGTPGQAITTFSNPEGVGGGGPVDREAERKAAFYNLNFDPEAGMVRQQGERAETGIKSTQAELIANKAALEKQRLSQLGNVTKEQSQLDLTRQAANAQTAQLQQLASGQGPSLAAYNLKLGQDRNVAQQLAMAAQQRGGGTAAAQRNMANLAAQGQQQLAQQAGQASLQEQQAYQAMLQSQLQNQQNLASTAAQNYNQQVSQLTQNQITQAANEKAGYEALLQQRLAEGMSMRMAEVQAKQDYEKLLTNQLMNQQNIASQEWMANKQANTQLLGGLIGGAGMIGAAAMSDKRSKKEIESGSKDIDNFLAALSASKYEYKEPNKPYRSEGKHVSVMAQDLEKSDIGSKMVIDTPEGKVVNYAKGLPAMLAAQAELHSRLRKLEKRLEKKGLK